MKMRGTGLTLFSLALTSAVIGNAYYHKKQFYPSVVYITYSNLSMAVIYFQASIMVYLIGKLMRKIFFGELRATEFEHLMERGWYAITETCLAFTVFRDDFSPKFVALFTMLLFFKSFHGLAEDRVDFMERSPVISLLFHVRVCSLLILLTALDIYFIEHAYFSTVTKGASVQLVFGFEYAILATIALNIAIKYILHNIDLTSETPWENKAVFLLYTELVMGFFKVMLYVAFVAIMIRVYTLPLFAFRPMYYAMRKLKEAYNDVILSRRAIQNMNTLYPDATPEELAAADNVCIICREEMTTASKKLPCNHIFHTACLRSWFQRQQTCPTCRLNILRAPAPPAPQAAPQQPAAAGPPPRPFPFWQQPVVVPGAAPAPGAQPGPSTSATAPPRFMAPMPPPFMMGMFPPPPMPPPDFAGLSDEELARMEGENRENVEARLQCLRQIDLLLNAASTVMTQYLAIAPANLRPTMPGPSSSSTVPPTTVPDSANQGEASTPPPTTSTTSETTTTTGPIPVPESSPASSGAADEPIIPGPSKESPTTPSSNGTSPAVVSSTNESQQAELRRLRLQKFSQE